MFELSHLRSDDVRFYGGPKTVRASHGNVASCFASLEDLFALRSTDVYLHTSRFAFAVGVRQTLLPLCCAATVLLADDDKRHEPRKLLVLMCRHAATIWDTVPSVLSVSLDVIQTFDPATTKRMMETLPDRVIATGEALRWSVAAKFWAVLGRQRILLNLYAQTESFGALCGYRVPDIVVDTDGSVPVGMPSPHNYNSRSNSPTHDTQICSSA